MHLCICFVVWTNIVHIFGRFYIGEQDHCFCWWMKALNSMWTWAYGRAQKALPACARFLRRWPVLYYCNPPISSISLLLACFLPGVFALTWTCPLGKHAWLPSLSPCSCLLLLLPAIFFFPTYLLPPSVVRIPPYPCPTLPTPTTPCLGEEKELPSAGHHRVPFAALTTIFFPILFYVSHADVLILHLKHLILSRQFVCGMEALSLLYFSWAFSCPLHHHCTDRLYPLLLPSNLHFWLLRFASSACCPSLPPSLPYFCLNMANMAA